MLDDIPLTYKMFTITMFQVETCLNPRSYTPMTEDQRYLEPLT